MGWELRWRLGPFDLRANRLRGALLCISFCVQRIEAGSDLVGSAACKVVEGFRLDRPAGPEDWRDGSDGEEAFRDCAAEAPDETEIIGGFDSTRVVSTDPDMG